MRAAAGLALALGFAAAFAGQAAQAQPRSGDERSQRRTYANPSAVIAAELALSRAAREKGQWRALRDAAARDAVLFAPGAIEAAGWLKRQAEPATPDQWEPYAVWLSCDGGHAAVRGAWTRGDARGEYFAVWERQKKGTWNWLVREQAAAGDPGAAPEMIAGRVAECSGLSPRRSGENGAAGPAEGISRDGSLRWTIEAASDCARALTVEAWDGRALAQVHAARRDPPAAGCG